ncbi:hypothetical protein EDD86DRAFT_128077 [Gorgonomyces haynaldii]|nr:hypothetical protein EDD86DRAFT_128077 [Gorgonomyces haynaldii]
MPKPHMNLTITISRAPTRSSCHDRYSKLRQEDAMAFGELYHPPPISSYNSLSLAPAAFGAYPLSPEEAPMSPFRSDSKYQQGYGMVTGQSMSPEYKDCYPEHYEMPPQGEDMSGFHFSGHNWYPHGQFEFEQFSEFIQDEDKDRHLPFPHQFSGSMHINPAMLEGSQFGSPSYSEVSGSVTSPREKKEKKPVRSSGQPTNIVPTAKMDKKTLKRLRNRVSASRCRIKKKEWINEMEERAVLLKEENRKLSNRCQRLQDAVAHCRALLDTVPQETGLGIQPISQLNS